MLKDMFINFTGPWQEAMYLVSSDGKILNANRYALRMLGVGLDAISGRSIDRFVEEEKEKVLQYTRSCSGSKSVVIGKLTWKVNDKPSIECRCEGFVIQPRDKGNFAIIIIKCTRKANSNSKFSYLNFKLEKLQKIYKQLRREKFDLEKNVAHRNRELQEAHNQLIQSEKLASIGQLAAGVAHEINNPVGFIGSNIHSLEGYIKSYSNIIFVVEKIKQAVDSDDLKKAKETVQELKEVEEKVNLDFIMNDVDSLLQESQRGVERVKKIVLDLKTFSREDSEEKEWSQVEAIIDSVLSVVHNELKYKAEVKKEYSETPQIKCHSQKLGQVFINLLVNAAHAIEEKGVITVKTYQEQNNVCIEVSDTGKGISEENLRKIFDPFFTTKQIGMGTGLGLSISYEIVKRHGGEIIVVSKLNKGTTFKIQLPITN